jgi:two-component system, chemotaxis family, chemotaxis protein CheY
MPIINMLRKIISNISGDEDPMKIIIADDSKVMRNIIENAVKPLGLATLHAGNGQEVLDFLKKEGNEIGLILLDWNMPVMNGLEVLETIKKNNLYPNIPVLIVSTESEDDKMSKAFAAGAKGYISKPFTAERLLNLVRGRISS